MTLRKGKLYRITQPGRIWKMDIYTIGQQPHGFNLPLKTQNSTTTMNYSNIQVLGPTLQVESSSFEFSNRLVLRDSILFYLETSKITCNHRFLFGDYVGWFTWLTTPGEFVEMTAEGQDDDSV